MAAVASLPSEYNVEFYKDDEGRLAASLDTEKLHIRTVQPSEKDHENFAALFGDPEVMKTYGEGKPRERDDVIKRIDGLWVQRLKNQDPYVGLAVLKDDEFVGHIVLGHDDNPGESQLAYLFHQRFWNQKIGTESVTAVVKRYAPATVQQGYLLDGVPLHTILASARHPASIRILERLGMKLVKKEEKFGAMRNHYSLKI